MAAQKDKPDQTPEEPKGEPETKAKGTPEGGDGTAPQGAPEPQLDEIAELGKSLDGIRAMLSAQAAELQTMREFVSNFTQGGGLNASIGAEDGGGEPTPAAKTEGDEEYPEIDLESLAKTIGA